MLVLLTQRSTYLLDADLGLLLQVPGGTHCGIEHGQWHRVLIEQVPRVGEPLFCTVAPTGGSPMGLRTSPVQWVGPPPAVPAYVDASVAAYAQQAPQTS